MSPYLYLQVAPETMRLVSEERPHRFHLLQSHLPVTPLQVYGSAELCQNERWRVDLVLLNCSSLSQVKMKVVA